MFPLEKQLPGVSEWPQESRAELAGALPPWETVAADTVRPDPSEIPDEARAMGAFGAPNKFYTEGIAPTTLISRVEGILEYLEARVFGFWEGSGSAHTNVVVSRRVAPAMFEWEWLEANASMTPQQRAKGRACFAFLADLFSLDSYYPGSAAMGLVPGSELDPTIQGMANQNFYTDAINVAGVAAQVFWRHPHAEIWRKRFETGWQAQLNTHVDPVSGVWEESHTYFHHVLATVIPTLKRRTADHLGDDFASANLQRATASLIGMVTPRLDLFQGCRVTVPLGDHGIELSHYRPLYRELANAFMASNPALASLFSWAYAEMGGELPLPIAPEAPKRRDESVSGLGFFFREEDSLLVLRAGRTWGHHHHDDGSIQWYAGGRACVVDSAFGFRQQDSSRKMSAAGHSRWSPDAFVPLNYRWRFNRGWIVSHGVGAELVYASAFTPVFMAETPWRPHYAVLPRPILHWRTVVRLASNVFLVVDESDHAVPSTMRFHIPRESPVRLLPLVGCNPEQSATDAMPVEAGPVFSTREVAFRSARLAAVLMTLGDEWDCMEGAAIIGPGAHYYFSAGQHDGFLLEDGSGRGHVFRHPTPNLGSDPGP
jgi:hypothetical protein